MEESIPRSRNVTIRVANEFVSRWKRPPAIRSPSRRGVTEPRCSLQISMSETTSTFEDDFARPVTSSPIVFVKPRGDALPHRFNSVSSPPLPLLPPFDSSRTFGRLFPFPRRISPPLPPPVPAQPPRLSRLPTDLSLSFFLRRLIIASVSQNRKNLARSENRYSFPRFPGRLVFFLIIE